MVFSKSVSNIPVPVNFDIYIYFWPVCPNIYMCPITRKINLSLSFICLYRDLKSFIRDVDFKDILRLAGCITQMDVKRKFPISIINIVFIILEFPLSPRPPPSWRWRPPPSWRWRPRPPGDGAPCHPQSAAIILPIQIEYLKIFVLLITKCPKLKIEWGCCQFNWYRALTSA